MSKLMRLRISLGPGLPATTPLDLVDDQSAQRAEVELALAPRSPGIGRRPECVVVETFEVAALSHLAAYPRSPICGSPQADRQV